MKTVFTMPGKKGDSILQWPIPFWWHRETGKPMTLWLDKGSLGPLVGLYQSQPGVEEVKLIDGIEHYRAGGQPWHFDLPASASVENMVIHLGFRGFPDRQITVFTRDAIPIKLKVSPQEMAETPTLVVPESPKANRVVLHGTTQTHGRETPGFWRFLAGVRKDLEQMFDEVVFIGTPRELETAVLTYPDWKTFEDGGDFLALGSYINASALVIGAGSSGVTLGGALKRPTIRVHDDIAGISKTVWNNLGSTQWNLTEIELRTEWPKVKERLKAEEPCPSVTS